MSKKPCPCGAAGARKVKCVCEPAPSLCEPCTLTHRCPSLENVDPKAWRKANAPEEALTTQVIKALNALAGVTAWRTKTRQGARASNDLDGVPDVQGFMAPTGRAFYVETKRNHKSDCACDSCASQRDFAARAAAAGCIVVLDVRIVKQAIEGIMLAEHQYRKEAICGP